MENRTAVDNEVLNIIKQKIENIEYGSVTVVIQDSRIVQLETNEKTRLK